MSILRSARLALCAAVAAGPALSQTGATQPAGRGHNDSLFQRMDSSRDGRISRAEAERLKHFLPAFKQSDVDGDGRLSPEEFASARAIYERSLAAQFLSDSLVTARVRAALMRSGEWDKGAIIVETREGQVTLSGSVPLDEHRLRAARIAASVAGVTAVTNGLEVGLVAPAGAMMVTQPSK